MVTDPIADLLTRIRNAYRAGRMELQCPHSQLKYAVCKVLAKNNFIESVNVSNEGTMKMLDIVLKAGIAPTLRRVSKPGQRIYIKSTDIKKVKNGLGISVLSTSKGIMTGYEANHIGIGGEYLCDVY